MGPKSTEAVPPLSQHGGTRAPSGAMFSSHLTLSQWSQERLGCWASPCWALLTSNGCQPSHDRRPDHQASLSHGAAAMVSWPNW